jgi:hypothetical protein
VGKEVRGLLTHVPSCRGDAVDLKRTVQDVGQTELSSARRKLRDDE